MTEGQAHYKMARAAKWIMDIKDKTEGLSKGKLYERIKTSALSANSRRHKGKVRSPEELDKQRASRILTGANIFSPEHKAKIALAARHKVKSPEEIAKFKETMKERQHKRSPEATAQMLSTRASRGPEYAESVKAKWRATRERNRLLKLQENPARAED
jgi:hypothetical protein